MHVDHDAWRVLCHHNPGIAIYPHRITLPARPAVRPAVRPPAPVPDVALPPVTRWRWWHRWARR